MFNIYWLKPSKNGKDILTKKIYIIHKHYIQEIKGWWSICVIKTVHGGFGIYFKLNILFSYQYQKIVQSIQNQNIHNVWKVLEMCY